MPSQLSTVRDIGPARSDWTRLSKPLRILLAEDDGMIALLLAEIFVELGHHVCAIAATEAELVAAAALHRPDIMIVDANLREGSGVAGVQRALAAGHVPHVYISGGTVRGTMLGAQILAKPFSDQELMEAMERALVSTAWS